MDTVTLINQGKTLAIKTDYSTGNFEIRKIKNAKWVSSTKEWHVPVEMQKEVDAVFEKKAGVASMSVNDTIITGDTIELDMSEPAIQDYTDKSIVVYGHQSDDIIDEFKRIGGLYNKKLRNGQGWIFKKNQREKVESIIFKASDAVEKHDIVEKRDDDVIEKPKEIVKQKPSFYNVETDSIKAVKLSEDSKSVRVYGEKTAIDFSIRDGYEEFNITDISDDSFRRYAAEIFSRPSYMTDNIMQTMNRRIAATRVIYFASYSVKKNRDRAIIFDNDNEIAIIESTNEMIEKMSPDDFLDLISNPVYDSDKQLFKITDNRKLDINHPHTFKYKYVDKSIVFENDTMMVTISDDDIYAYDIGKFFGFLQKIINGEKTQEFSFSTEKKLVPFLCQR